VGGEGSSFFWKATFHKKTPYNCKTIVSGTRIGGSTEEITEMVEIVGLLRKLRLDKSSDKD